MTDFIPQIEPWIDDSELKELRRVIESTYVVEHDLTKEFESMICDLTGSKYAVAMTNGTVALFCCLKALGIGKGDEVIVPNMTFIASANAVLLCGATPVLCEVDPYTFCMRVEDIEACVSDSTKAIMPVHLYGQCADMNSIMDFANERNIQVVEDAAQGVGVLLDGQHVGTFGQFGVLSFYGNKTLTCGEGGVIITDDKDLRDCCYRLKNHGRDGKGTFKHDHIGYNFCFTEMQAAVGISQMKKLTAIIEKKKQIHDLYVKELSDISPCFTPVHKADGCTPVYWFTSFMCDKKTELIEYMRSKNIQTREFFYPLNDQPCYAEEDSVRMPVDYTNSMDLFNRGISLPSSYNLTEENQIAVINTLKEWLFKN
jgi:perosamine synthetase